MSIPLSCLSPVVNESSSRQWAIQTHELHSIEVHTPNAVIRFTPGLQNEESWRTMKAFQWRLSMKSLQVVIEVGSLKIGRTKLNTKCHRNYKRKKHMLMSEFARWNVLTRKKSGLGCGLTAGNLQERKRELKWVLKRVLKWVPKWEPKTEGAFKELEMAKWCWRIFSACPD